jgi:hypothetical protein
VSWVKKGPLDAQKAALEKALGGSGKAVSGT